MDIEARLILEDFKKYVTKQLELCIDYKPICLAKTRANNRCTHAATNKAHTLCKKHYNSDVQIRLHKNVVYHTHLPNITDRAQLRPGLGARPGRPASLATPARSPQPQLAAATARGQGTRRGPCASGMDGIHGGGLPPTGRVAGAARPLHVGWQLGKRHT